MPDTGQAKRTASGLEIEGAPRWQIRNCYRLELEDAMTVDLLTTAESDHWIRKIARVMHLRREPHAETAQTVRKICESGPQARRYGVLTLRSNGNGTHLVSGVGASMPQQLTVREVWQSFYPFYQRLAGLGGLPLHAALVQRGARNVLLAAPAGTGKSTCCRRLPASWKPVCDEEVVLVPSSDGTWHAHPFPTWSDIVERQLDRRWDVKQHVPVSAVFLLEQGDTDIAEPVGVGEATLFLSRRVQEKCFFLDWRLEQAEARGFRHDLFENVCRLAAAIPTYKLTASTDGRFWEEMERVMNV
jgi:SynChlorMet cassette protein ScmC